MSVSVCIPTYKRVDLLRSCIESCLQNEVRPLEIIVSDDDGDPAVPDMLGTITVPEGVSLHYVRNRLGKGQSANVNSAFQAASHERVVLIHDDDFFVPRGIDRLCAAWDGAGGKIDAVFGKQRIVSAEGSILAEQTSANEAAYHRGGGGGIQPAVRSALLQQFPNIGFMIRRGRALEIGYPDESEVGLAPVDFHFGLRLAIAAKHGYLFVAEDVTCYRLSEVSVARTHSRAHRRGHLGYEEIAKAKATAGCERYAFDRALDHHAPAAIEGYLEASDSRRAREVFRSHPAMPISRAGRARLGAAILFHSIGLRKLGEAIRHFGR